MIPNGRAGDSREERRRELIQVIREKALGARAGRRFGGRVSQAVECGKALEELRQLVGRGEWTACLETECGLNRMTANRYMRLSGQTDKLGRWPTLREAYIAAGVISPRKALP